MSLHYCDIVVSWAVERSEKFLSAFRYKVTQSDSDSVNDQSSQDEEGQDGTYNYCQLSQEPTESNHKPEPCVVQLKCKSPYNVSIVGIEIVSESRTQELYDDTDTYIMTASLKEITNGLNDRTLYRNSVSWEKPRNQCSIKFLSLGGKEAFELCQVTVHLTQGSSELTPSTVSPQTGHFDMNKVKDLVGSMGGTLSERAQAFMTTMEQYQHNQESSFADIEKMIGKSSLSKAGKQSGTGGDMSRFVSMFATMNKLQKQMPAMNSGTFPEVSMNSLGQSLSMAHMESGENGSINGESPGAMFSFLKNICGKVTQMRENEDRTKSALLSKEEESVDLPNESKLSQSDPSKTSYSELEQRLIQHIDRIEERLEVNINKRLEKLEENLNKKLDNILALLGQTVPGDGVGLYDSIDRSSSSSDEEDQDLFYDEALHVYGTFETVHEG